jgi:hypothetical protein
MIPDIIEVAVRPVAVVVVPATAPPIIVLPLHNFEKSSTATHPQSLRLQEEKKYISIRKHIEGTTRRPMV